jgi:hypothetical protein
MRPFDGVFFGNFGDRHGRKNAIIITITGLCGNISHGIITHAKKE